MPLAETAERMVIWMTMDDIKAMTDDFITPATAAAVMKMDVGRLIAYARSGQLPFPVQISGNRVKIGRIGFLKAFGVEVQEKERKDEIARKLDKLISELHTQNAVLMGLLVHFAPEISDAIIMKCEEAVQ